MLMTDPLSIVGRLHRIGELSDRGQIEEAHELADQLLAQSPTKAYLAHASLSLWSEGKIAESLSWALRAPADNDDHVMIAFALVGEFDEARRVNARETYWVDVAEGRLDEAIRATQRVLQLYPNSGYYIVNAAEVLYFAGRIDEALPIYERALESVPEGQPMEVPGWGSLAQTMRLALARRKVGDEEGAQAAAQIAKRELAAVRAAGIISHFHDLAEAMIAAFENDPEGVVAALTAAVERGLRIPSYIYDPIFADLRDKPRLVALRQELDAILAVEHDKVLQLICFNNPVPEDWQPMPETCEGVVEQRSL